MGKKTSAAVCFSLSVTKLFSKNPEVETTSCVFQFLVLVCLKHLKSVVRNEDVAWGGGVVVFVS